MTAFDLAPRAAVPSLLARAGDCLFALLMRLAEASPAARCAREADRLSTLSEAELALMGLTRDRIVPYAFRAYL